MTQKINQDLLVGSIEVRSEVKVAEGAAGFGGTITPNTNVALTEVQGQVRKVTLTLTDFVISITDANAYGGTKLCDLPDSNASLFAIEMNLSCVKDGTGILAGEQPTVAIGTAIASNATLSGAMVDVLDEVTLAATATATATLHSNANSTPGVSYLADSATAALYLNSAVNPTGDGTLTITGTIDMWFLDTGNLGS